MFNQLTDTLIGGASTLTSTYADTSNTERLTAGQASFINGTPRHPALFRPRNKAG